MINIGIIGFGFVGKSVQKAFEYNATFTIVDPAYTSTTINEIAEKTDIVFVCLPAPTLSDNEVNCNSIISAFSSLEQLGYKGVVVLKSTVPPDVVDSLSSYSLRYVYSPEFLRAAHWEEDALNPNLIILAGNSNDIVYVEQIYCRHSHLENKDVFKRLDYKEAALAKYAINTFLATKVVFMNQLYQLYTDMYGKEPHWQDWQYFTEIIAKDKRIGSSHMLVPDSDGLFGYGGACFPKDVRGLLGVDKNGRLSVLKEVDEANTKLRLS